MIILSGVSKQLERHISLESINTKIYQTQTCDVNVAEHSIKHFKNHKTHVSTLHNKRYIDFERHKKKNKFTRSIDGASEKTRAKIEIDKFASAYHYIRQPVTGNFVRRENDKARPGRLVERYVDRGARTIS